jgi:hypothetical protein
MFDFMKDFTSPIDKDGREHIDYVPTQVVSEYFRSYMKTSAGTKVDGIIYPSAQNDKPCCVLFCGQEGCVSSSFGNKKQLLEMDKDSLEIIQT